MSVGMATSTAVACTFCGHRFDSADVIPLLDCLVCAGCKPGAVQRLQEGSPLLPDDFPRLSFSAVDPKGKQVTEKVSAASAAAARDVLLHRGYTGVVLHEDDAHLAGRKFFEKPGAKKKPKQANISAKDEVRLGRARTIWPFVLVMLRKTWVMSALGILLIALGRPVGGGGVLVFLALVIGWAGLPLGGYQKLMRAVEQARWKDVTKAVRRARLINRLTPAKIPEFELVFREAQVTAAEGRIEEAFSMVAPFENAPNVEPWMYCNRLSVLCSIVQDYEGQVQWSERAMQAAPESFGVVVDLALVIIRRRHDADRGQELLELARDLPSSDLVDHALPLCEGLIAFENGKYVDAVHRLDEAEVEIRRNIGAFFMPLFLSMCQSYQALALARLGDRTRAHELYRQAQPWMVAWRETELMAALEAELEPARV